MGAEMLADSRLRVAPEGVSSWTTLGSYGLAMGVAPKLGKRPLGLSEAEHAKRS